MKNQNALTLITVAAYDLDRLAKTFASCKKMNSNFEHLLVIPNRDSKTLQKANEYLNEVSYEVRIVNDNNKGIYQAMNIGVCAANGEYILFLNAGDEVYSSSILDKNIKELSKNKPEWAIAGVVLPWNSEYLTYEGMEKKFRLQKPNSYISHQTVIVRKDIFDFFKGLDVKFSIAADTKMIMQLATRFKPYLLNGIAIRVEEGFNVTSHNRESRIEVLKIISTIGPIRDRLISNFYFFKREFKFLANRILKIF